MKKEIKNIELKIIENSKNKKIASDLLTELRNYLKGAINQKISPKELEPIFLKHYNKEITTNESLKIAKISKGSYFRYYKSWKIENSYLVLCKKCNLYKEHTEFNKDNQAKNGLQSYCRECKKA